jgi:hypothetical protein
MACKEKEDEPALVGIPEIVPLDVLKVKPAGNDPTATLQV